MKEKSHERKNRMSRLGEIETRLNASTPGPWEISEHELNGRCCGVGPIQGYDGDALDLMPDDPDVKFIAHARTDMELLIEEVKGLRKALIADENGNEYEVCRIAKCERNEALARILELEKEVRHLTQLLTQRTMNYKELVAMNQFLKDAMKNNQDAVEQSINKSMRIEKLEAALKFISTSSCSTHDHHVHIAVAALQANPDRILELEETVKQLQAQAQLHKAPWCDAADAPLHERIRELEAEVKRLSK